MTYPRPVVTLLRHGETTWSKSGQHTSRTDLPLTDLGEMQAKAAQTLLDDAGYDLVLVSPRQRARCTAELAGLTPYEIDDDLQEWDYGDFEGRTSAEIREDHPGWSTWEGPWVGGETATQVGIRVDRVVARILERPSGGRVALVAHSHILRVVAARWVGAPVTAGRWWDLNTGAVCELNWEHDYRVLHRWNMVAGS